MRTTTGNSSILGGLNCSDTKLKLRIRNFIQGHPFHLVEPSPYPLLVSLALLITTLSGVMTFHSYSNGAFLLSLLCFLSTVFAVTISLQGEPKGDLLLRFLICLLLVVYIILLHSLYLLALYNNDYV
jgi:hypothetical protein